MVEGIQEVRPRFEVVSLVVKGKESSRWIEQYVGTVGFI